MSNRDTALAAAGRSDFLAELPERSNAFAHIGPNWFASVMGTGIVANAAVSLPVHVTGLRVAARLVWVLAGVMLIAIASATALHWKRHRSTARSHVMNPVMSHFYGAPPMAMLTVGAGALLVGRDLIGLRAAVDLDWVLWTAGTITGLITAVAVPYLMFTRHRYGPDAAFGGWLMPIVPPMVSAATGALLVPHLASKQAKLSLIYGCYAMFGLALFASVVTITLIWGRLAQHKQGTAALLPTLWIVLGPLGQSVTAAGLLANASVHVLASPYPQAAAGFALIYGTVTIGFAAMWFTIAAALTISALRKHMTFSLTWWSFTFPVGTCVTGLSGLATRSGADLFKFSAAGLYAFLIFAWVAVATRTLRGALRGRLLLPPAAPVHVEAAVEIAA
jgi:C4-dicarboxylate transporter/malic acid transport protein